MDTKDITVLINERKKRNTEEEKKKRELFEFNVGKEKEQAKMRKELEQAYEREKSKSVISKRCARIYDNHLLKLEPNLVKHLNENEVVPELHLTRWLRCVMSREYDIESTAMIWDFIFSGVKNSKIDLNNPFENED